MLLILMAMAAVAAGCSATPNFTGAAASRQARLEAVRDRLAAAAELGRLHVCLGDAGGRAAAFAWADGRIMVTRELVDLLDDEELLAAVAHEVGHLIVDQRLAGHRALTGESLAGDAELAADRAGTVLLGRCGADAAAMPRMLLAVAGQPGLAPGLRQQLRHRAQQLSPSAFAAVD
jgi:predicted Zn-dependent protease